MARLSDDSFTPSSCTAPSLISGRASLALLASSASTKTRLSLLPARSDAPGSS